VLVRLSAEKLTMPDGDKSVTLPAGQTTEIEIEVVALSNGRFPVQAEVLSPLGNRLTEPVELQARVNTLSGVGWVFTVGFVLALASWWYSHLRKRHKARRLDVVAALDRHPVRAGTARADADPAPGDAMELVTGRGERRATTIDADTDPFTDVTLVAADNQGDSHDNPGDEGPDTPVAEPSDDRGSVSDP